jgi:hypothetical protein
MTDLEKSPRPNWFERMWTALPFSPLGWLKSILCAVIVIGCVTVIRALYA